MFMQNRYCEVSLTMMIVMMPLNINFADSQTHTSVPSSLTALTTSSAVTCPFSSSSISPSTQTLPSPTKTTSGTLTTVHVTSSKAPGKTFCAYYYYDAQ